MRWFTADLHVHTDLSPCAKAMSPGQIVRAAEEAGVDFIAICDHNSAANVAAVQAAAASKVGILPGLEVNTREEVHLVCLFDHLEGALALQEVVYRELPGENDEGIFGPQWLYNEEGERIGLERRLLAGSCRLSMQAVIAFVDRLGGLVIAPHPERTYGGIIGVLGFIPKDVKLGAIEMPLGWLKDFCLRGIPGVIASDAHRVEEIGPHMAFYMERIGLREMDCAWRGLKGHRTHPKFLMAKEALER